MPLRVLVEGHERFADGIAFLQVGKFDKTASNSLD
jgi:hypothetical protein